MKNLLFIILFAIFAIMSSCSTNTVDVSVAWYEILKIIGTVLLTVFGTILLLIYVFRNYKIF